MIKRIALPILATLALLLGFAAPAQAVTTCSFTGAACVWTGANYSGTRTVLQGWPCTELEGGANNSTTSLKVNASPSSNDWTFYIDSGCDPAGGWITYSNGTSIADLASAVDNKYSSAGSG
jgi:hypothetical protein